MKKTAAIILILALLLAGCGKADEPAKQEDQAPEGYGLDISTGQWTGEGGSFVLKSFDLPDEGWGTIAMLPYQDDIVYIGSGFEGNAGISYKGKTAAINGTLSTETCCAGDGGIWTILYRSTDGEGHHFAVLITPEGDTLKEIDLDSIYSGARSWPSIAADGEILYLLAYGDKDAAVVVTAEGELLGTLDCEGTDMLQGGDGKVYFYDRNGDGYDVYRAEGTGLTQEPVFSCEDETLCDGGEGSCLLLLSSEGLYSIGPDGSRDTIAIWAENAIPVNGLYDAVALPGGRYALRSMGGYQLLEPVDPSELKLKTRLTMAQYWAGSNSEIAAFNAASDDYYIEVLDYSDDGTVDLDTAQTRLLTDVVSGKAPDMISFNRHENLSPFPFIRKGLAADMKEFFNSDSDVSLDDIAIAKALDMNGHIYYISGTFGIDTVLGRYDEFGESFGWTLDDYLNKESGLPADKALMAHITGEIFLEQLATQYIERNVDWDKGTCDFDTWEFASILKAAARIHETPETAFGLAETLVANGSSTVESYYLEHIQERYKWQQRTGCAFSYIGWPTPDGSCGSSANPSGPFIVMKQSPNLQGCWEYIKFLLLNASRDPGSSELPVYLPALKSLLEAAQDPELETHITWQQVCRQFETPAGRREFRL